MKDAIKLLAAVVVPLAMGGLSGFATARGVADWYPSLAKPAFTPPAWVSFAAVLNGSIWMLNR